MKSKNIKHTALFAIILIGLYFLTRYGLSAFYTPEWSARRIYWIIAFVVLLPVLFGRFRFSAIALIGYVIGLVAGELFGGFQADIPPQFLHYGWLILISVFLIACVFGVFVERRYGIKKC